MIFQHYGITEAGGLAFAGTTESRRATATMARRIAREWVSWARRYVAEHPGDYPLVGVVRGLPADPVVEIQLHPCGRQDQLTRWDVSSSRASLILS